MRGRGEPILTTEEKAWHSMESVYSVAQDLGRAEEEGCPAYSLYGRKTEFAVMMRTGMVASSILTVKSKILILIPNFDICFCIISTKETHKKWS